VPADRAAAYFATVRSQWRLVFAIAALALAGGLIASALATKRYDATAKVLLTGAEPVDTLVTNPSRSLDPERDVNTSVELLRLESVARPVRDRLRLSTSVSELLGQVRVAPEGNSNVVAITSRDTHPRRAAAIANAFAREYVVFRREAAAEKYQDAATLARARLESLPRDSGTEPIRRTLQTRIDQLEATAPLLTGGVQLLDDAAAPSRPATPPVKLNIALSLIVGLFLGSCLAVLLGRRTVQPVNDPAEAPAIDRQPVRAAPQEG
jgi:uncharacterized protein involved in exopolysaccharide biosynthesis